MADVTALAAAHAESATPELRPRFLSRIRPAPGRAPMIPRQDKSLTYDAHQVVWRFFGDTAERARDFRFRFDFSEQGPVFYVVSAREPLPVDGWRVETRPYAPAFAVGERCRLKLRLNPTVNRERKRFDLVREALERAGLRDADEDDFFDTGLRAEVIRGATLGWLRKRTARFGFSFADVDVATENYRVNRFTCADGDRVAMPSVDVFGTVTVENAMLFRNFLLTGHGQGGAFGLGLPLLV